MKSYAFLFWGDVIVWAGMAAYVAVLVRKMARVERRLESIEAVGQSSDRTAT
jgi:CcmD family protein